MLFKCFECGHIFEEGEESHRIVCCRESFGGAYSEEMTECPLCGGAYGEAVECLICGEAHLKEELTEEVCTNCLESYENDIEMCFKLFEGEKELIEVNSFFVSLFGDDLDCVILDLIKSDKDFSSKLCKQYINSDRNAFAEKISNFIAKNK